MQLPGLLYLILCWTLYGYTVVTNLMLYGLVTDIISIDLMLYGRVTDIISIHLIFYAWLMNRNV